MSDIIFLTGPRRFNIVFFCRLGCVYQVLLVVLPSVEINVASIAITVCLILSSQVIMFRETGVLGNFWPALIRI